MGSSEPGPAPGPAPVASFDDIDVGEAAAAPVAVFDNGQVGAARGPVPIADVGGAVRQQHRARRPAVVARSARRDPPEQSRPEQPRPTQDVDGAGPGGAGPHSPPESPESEPAAEPDAGPQALARSICLRLLTDRARTRLELAQALRRKGVPDEAANAVLERYGEVGLIDDAAFAGQWVRSRHVGRGLGRRAIAVELRRKGVDDDVAGDALAGIDAGAEERRARQLVDRKLRGMAAGTREERTSAARRLAGMLARKGYEAGVAYRVVREAIAENGAEIEELGAVDD